MLKIEGVSNNVAKDCKVVITIFWNIQPSSVQESLRSHGHNDTTPGNISRSLPFSLPLAALGPYFPSPALLLNCFIGFLFFLLSGRIATALSWMGPDWLVFSQDWRKASLVVINTWMVGHWLMFCQLRCCYTGCLVFVVIGYGCCPDSSILDLKVNFGGTNSSFISICDKRKCSTICDLEIGQKLFCVYYCILDCIIYHVYEQPTQT